MKKHFCFLLIIVLLGSTSLHAQNIAIGTNLPHPSAKLEIRDTAKGILIPRIDSMHRINIIDPATGLLVYETTSRLFWYYDGNGWVKINAKPSAIADADGNTSVKTEKNNNEDIIRFSIKGNEQWNMTNARLEPSNTSNSIFIGKGAGLTDDLSYSKNNIAIGDSSLLLTTTGINNIAIGSRALYKNTSGKDLIAIGDSALFDQSTDIYDAFGNTAIGTRSMRHNISGYHNTATGLEALYNNVTGSFNLANGRQALYHNIDGIDNSAVGNQALFLNTSGSVNTAIGDWAARANTTGNFNTAVGSRALYNNIDGGSNSATGVSSLNNTTSGNYNTANGYRSGFINETGNYNTFIGSHADATTINISKSGAIGYNAKVSQSNCFVIGGTGADAVNVGIGITAPTERLDVAGNIKATGTITPSDMRYKTNILPLQNCLKSILSLNGVTYLWNTGLFTDKGFSQTEQIGFIAQDIEKIFPQIVHTDSNGYKGVDYSKLIPALVEALKEEHTQNDALKARVEALERLIHNNVIGK